MYKLKTILSLCAITVFGFFGFFASSCLDENGDITYKIRVNAKDFLVEEPPLKTLVGTEWKLVAFVDVENNTSRPPIYNPMWDPSYTDTNDSYTIYFDSTDVDESWWCDNPTFFTAPADCNTIYGCYLANYTDFTVKIDKMLITAMYLAYENDEGNYESGIRHTEEFELTTKHLKLFYNNKKNYLLFNRRK